MSALAAAGKTTTPRTRPFSIPALRSAAADRGESLVLTRQSGIRLSRRGRNVPSPRPGEGARRAGEGLRIAGATRIIRTAKSKLGLAGTRVTDGGLVHLKGFTNLTCLDLSDTQVTDAGLARLSQLAKLRELGIGRTRVTDAGLVHLAGLRNLRSLNLTGTQVSDRGLAKLTGLTNLTELELALTNVTDGGITELKRALPKLKTNQGPTPPPRSPPPP
jgi:hypothetical protein